MIVFGHRGARGYAPENTMPSFEKALAFGAAGIELDVQLTRDGVPIICHDHSIDRTSDGKGWIKDFTWKELRQYDFGGWFSPEYAGTRLPCLDDFLAWLKETTLSVNIEIKNGPVVYQLIEEKTLFLIEKYGLKSRVILSSFYHPCLKRFKELDPKIITGALFDSRPLDPLSYCRETGADCLHPNWHYLDADWATAAHLAGITINTWTVNHPSELAWIADCLPDCVISDYPDRFL